MCVRSGCATGHPTVSRYGACLMLSTRLATASCPVTAWKRPAHGDSLSTRRSTSPARTAHGGPLMDTITECVDTTLRAHPHPALRLSELVDLVSADVDRSMTPSRLRTILESHPERFRVLDSWEGRWAGRPGSFQSRSPGPRPQTSRGTFCACARAFAGSPGA